MKLNVMDRVKIRRRNGGGYEYGTICAISRDTFDGSIIYIVDFEAHSAAMHEEALTKVKRRKKNNKPTN